MARYDVTHTKAGINTANSPMWQVRAAASQRVWLYELGMFVATAPTTPPQFRVVRAATVGTSSATIVPQPEDPGSAAAVTLLDTTWTTAPTLAAVDLRSVPVPGSIGAGIVFTWYDTPLVIPAGAGLVIVNVNAAGATLGSLSMYCVLNE